MLLIFPPSFSPSWSFWVIDYNTMSSQIITSNKHKECTQRKTLIIYSFHLDFGNYSKHQMSPNGIQEYLIPLLPLLTGPLFSIQLTSCARRANLHACVPTKCTRRKQIRCLFSSNFLVALLIKVLLCWALQAMLKVFLFTASSPSKNLTFKDLSSPIAFPCASP